MISSKERITTSQAITILITSILGVGILSLPRDLVDLVKGDSFIVLVLGTIVCIVIGFFIYKIIDYFPNKSFLEINSILLSKPIAYLIGIIVLIYYIWNIGLITRIFVEVIKMYMLGYTPTEVIAISMILICAYGARGGIESIARLSQLLIFLIVIPVVGVLSLTLGAADFSNLMPIFQSSPMEITSAIGTTVFSFSGFEILLIIGFFLRKPSDGFKIQYISLICIGLMYIFFAVVTIAVFGMVETSHLLWPTLTLVKVINFPGAFLENLDALIMGAWTINIFMTICMFNYVSALLFGEVLKTKESTYLSFSFIPITYIIALYPRNLAHVYDILGSKNMIIYQAFIVIIIPTILIVTAMIYKRVKKI